MGINAFTSEESFFWHDTGNEALFLTSGGSIQPDEGAGELALVGQGSYGMTLLSAGGGITVVETAGNGECDDAYSLSRPPRRLAESDIGMGFVYLIIG